MKKRVCCIAMLIAIFVSSFSFSSFAASSKSIYVPTNRTWSSNAKCTLTNKKKAAKVRVEIDNWGANIDIRMRNGSKVIWSENNAIKSSNKLCARIYRDFGLGCDHTYYDLSFRCNKDVFVSPGVYVKAISNCKIS